MKKLYNVEKVLWLASQPRPLHVSPNEAIRFSDLDGIVEEQLEAGHLEKCGEDDSGGYYRCKHRGLVELYTLKIAWRRKNGKSTDNEEAELARLRTKSP